MRPAAGSRRITPAADYTDEDSRRLRFETNDPTLDVVRVRPFDVATFVAFGAAQIGICGADVLMEFDYPEIYAPLDLGIGKCRISVAEPAATAGTDDPPAGPACGSPRSIRMSRDGTMPAAASRPRSCTSTARWNWLLGLACRG